MQEQKVFYQEKHYWLPEKVKNRFEFVKKFFKIQNIVCPVSFPDRRRKSIHETAEACVVILSRIESFMNLGIPVVLGSKFLKDLPWATFGKTDHFEGIYFEEFKDVIKYYEDYFTGKDFHEIFPFRLCENETRKLADKYKKNSGEMMALAICLMCDIIWNCGPDCDELFDVFSNDVRDDPAFFDFGIWERQRVALMGSMGRVFEEPVEMKLGQLIEKPIEIKTIVVFDKLSSEIEDISENEITRPSVTEKSDYLYDEDMDWDEAAMYAYYCRAKECADPEMERKFSPFVNRQFIQ